MKSHLYAGTMSKVYSEALKYYFKHGNFLSDDLVYWEEELKKVSHRAYTNASLVEPADASSIFNERENSTETEWQMVGSVIEASPKAGIVMEVRNAFNQGDEIEILPFTGQAIKVIALEITDIMMKPVMRTKPSTLIKLPYQEGVEAFHLVRQKVKA